MNKNPEIVLYEVIINKGKKNEFSYFSKEIVTGKNNCTLHPPISIVSNAITGKIDLTYVVFPLKDVIILQHTKEDLEKNNKLKGLEL